MSDPDGEDRPAEPDEASDQADPTPDADDDRPDERGPDEETGDGPSTDESEGTDEASDADPDEAAGEEEAEDSDEAAGEEEAEEDGDSEDDETGDGGEAADDETPDDDENRITETDHVDLREGWEEYEERLNQQSAAADDEADADDEDHVADEDDADDADDDDSDSTTYDETDTEVYKTVRDPSTTPLERKTGPQSDREQPLTDHIEEMVKRLGIVIVIAGVVSLIAFPLAEDVVTFLWYSVLPEGISQPHVYHPLELIMTQLKTASLAGLIIALPVFVYETYAFMKPGLYPHERRYYLAAVPTSLILALVGVTFAYFIVLPTVMTYFLYYSRDVVDIAFALGQTFNLILILMGYLALVFQIPLFIMLAIMMGLASREWMEDTRLIFWGVFAGLSFLFSPDPTGMAPLIVAATMIVLFEGTLLLLRWTERGK